MSKALNVLVYGGTGSQSSPVVHHLLAKGHAPHVVTRNVNGTAAQSLQAAGARLVEGDMTDRARLTELSQDIDVVSLQIPFAIGDPMQGQAAGRNAIDAAQEAGVSLIVWNTSGGIPPQRTGDPGMDLRIEILDHLKASGVPHIIIEPTVYMENLLGPWTVPYVVNEDRLAYPNPAHMKFGWIASDDIGKLMVAAMERPELANEKFIVSGLENVDGNQLAERFSRGIGREIEYYFLPLNQFAAILNQAFGPGAGDAAAEIYGAMHEAPVQPPMWFDMQPVLDKLPVEMTSIEAWARQHRGAFAQSPVAAGAD